MGRGQQFLEEVRTWIGTPFHPHASAKGGGCDCKGLIWGAARELGFPEADTFYAKCVDYNLGKKNGIPSDLLKEGMARVFRRVKKMRPGDILLVSMDGEPRHMAVYSGDGKAIHAQIRSKAWVKETRLAALLHFCPLDSVWRWRDG